jgi:DNA-binding MarR family transcriptional regulator
MQIDNTMELVETIFNLSRLMKDEMSYTNDFTHLSILQIQALIYLKQRKEESTSMGDIANFFNIELPSATSLVGKLCEQKLVERRADQTDRRLVIIVLTNEGKTLLERAIVQRKKKLEKILSYLSGKERLELLNIIKTLNSKLQKK